MLTVSARYDADVSSMRCGDAVRDGAPTDGPLPPASLVRGRSKSQQNFNSTSILEAIEKYQSRGSDPRASLHFPPSLIHSAVTCFSFSGLRITKIPLTLPSLISKDMVCGRPSASIVAKPGMPLMRAKRTGLIP